MSVQAACDAVVAMIHTGQGDPLAATERILDIPQENASETRDEIESARVFLGR